jgi:S1-C subfamily serine protease
MEGTGSGVIVSADGYVLTNYHVVDGADDITVTLNDGRELKAQRIGTDPKTDLAVVRIQADHLTYAKFGNSDDLQVGDWVLAFGYPFGFSQTMTQGIHRPGLSRSSEYRL